MKKILSILFLLTFIFTLSGCDDPNKNPLECVTGYEIIGDACQLIVDPVTCEDGYTLNEATNECDEDVVPLVCETGYHEENEECVEDDPVCTIDELLVNGECVQRTCAIDKELINGECVEITCEEDYELIFGECKLIVPTCNNDETLIENECVLIRDTCTGDEIYYGNECILPEDICTTGFEFIDGECVETGLIELDIYYINDFHGAITYDGEEMGFARIANFIQAMREQNPNTLFLAGGDILQGSALSNYFLGESTIEILDLMGLDAFTLGNHEFDWGLEEVTKYFDEIEENGEADYPLLAANVFFKDTEIRPDFIDPYTIIQLQDFKVGIIGTIGSTLESSIATKRVEDYEFVDPLPYIEEYATYLRTVEGVDFVFVVAHDIGNINDAVINLTGDARIDAVFNGHSHTSYAYIDEIPVIQSGSNGEYLGHVEYVFNDGNLIGRSVENLDIFDDSLFLTPDAAVQALIDFYLADTEELFNNPLITAGEELYSNKLSQWIAELFRVKTESDIAFHNYGGTRRSIDDETVITIGILYEVWPFDNVIKTVYLTGAEINAFMASSSNAYSTNITTFVDDVLYKVATNDYVFDKTNNPFIYGANPENTGILLRELAIDEMILQSSTYTDFKTTNEILTQPDYTE